MKSRTIVKNGVIIYQPRKDQFGHISLDRFMKLLKEIPHTFSLRKSKKGI